MCTSLLRSIFLAFVLVVFSGLANAQPTVLGTHIVNGSYVKYDLNTVGGFKQVRLQASSNASTGTRNWEFARGTAASTDYTTNWRPWTGGNTQSTNIFTPTSFANGAKYNTSSGGASGLLPAITNGNYYTFNVSNNSSADNVMQLLETSFNPVTISAVSQAVGSAGSENITITTLGTPNASEYIYVRYSTDSYATSTLAQATGSGTSWSVNIPWQAAAISFYVYSSNKTLSEINSDVTTYGQGVHDMSTLNLNNNSGLNYSWFGNFIVKSTGGTFANGLSFSTLTGATGAFAALDATSAGTGAVNIYVNSSSTSETGTIPLNNSSNWTSINMYPTVTGLTISGSVAAPLINLYGADNVTIDGRVNGTGTSVDLTITNTSTSTSPGNGTSTIGIVGFANAANNNTIKYCTIKGSTLDAYSGVIFIYTSATSTNISNNNITSASDANRPLNAIYSGGSAITVNISNNNIYDFFNRTTASSGINLLTGTNTSTITGNSFYETTSFAPSASVDYAAINIYNNLSSFTVTGNYIGGNAPLCSGTWTKTNAFNNNFFGVFLNVGTGTPTVIEDNTLKGFAWSNATAAGWVGINAMTGAITVGSSGHPNTIGATTGTGSITLTNTTSMGGVSGINLAGSGYITCDYNTIGSITVANTDVVRSTSFVGIHRNNINASGSISHNKIGSNSTLNSIYATSTSTSAAQPVIGIWNDSIASTGVTINNDTIANMTNATTNSTISTLGVVNGIYSTDLGVLTISNNSIHDLTIANANTTTNASVSGIVVLLSTLSTVTNNTIYNLSNTYPSYAGYVSGIYFSGGSGANICSNNTIYGLSATGASVADAKIVALNYNAGTGANVTNANFIHSLSIPNSSTGSIYGIRVETGAATYSNNIINLGGTSNITQYGFYDTGLASQNSNLYFNTINIGGTVGSSSNNTYCLYSAAATNTRNFRNNIFSNTRSNTSGSGLHYAVSLTANTNLTSNYNDYYVSGTGAVLGNMGGTDKSTLALWKAATAQDINSFNTTPLLVSAGSTTATGYKTLGGLTGTAVSTTTDYNSASRSGTAPTMGAWERDINLWTGTTSSVYSLGTNWSKGTAPISTDNLVFAESPNNDCVLDGNYTVANVINQSIKKITIPTTRSLTVTNSITTDGNAGRIYIQASSGAVNGSLIYYNTVDNPVSATVEMFDKATYVSGATSTTNPANYHWQYFGIPVRSMTPFGTLDGSYVRRWNHAGAAWSLLKNDSIMSSFKGYEIAQIATKTITFAGVLENADYSATLDAKDGATIVGQYIFGNPYTAAININQLSFGAQTENSVYLFNTGSTAEWAARINNISPDANAGQYVVCPKGYAGTSGIPGQIPSMGGFLIKDTNTSGTHSFGITYNNVIQANTTTQRAKKADTSVSTIIDVKGARFADRMWIFTNPGCTKGFDNGWDGRKILGSALTPQLYAMEADGNYQVNTVDNINNSDLAFQAGEDSNYTLTFTHQNTTSVYSTLYLVDLLENKTTDISATGTEYSFTATPTTTPIKRFKIVTATGGTTENAKTAGNGLRVFGVQNMVMVHNYGTSSGNLTLYDINARILQTSIIAPFGITTMTTNLPDGCYVVKAKTNNMEVTEKVILNKSAK